MTATKEKAPKAEKSFKASEDAVRDIDCRAIITNSQNPRESAPQLLSLGYGLFAKQEGSDKPAVVPMALSDNPEDKAEYVKLIDKLEKEVGELGASILTNRQINPIRVRQVSGGYDLIAGVRRLLAILYNHCKTAGTTPARIKAIVTDLNNDHEAMYMAFDENTHRLNMTPIEQAKWFATMKNAGMKVREIAEKTKVGWQTVQQRLDLLKLPQTEQDKVHAGDLPVTKALALVKGKADPKDPKATNRGSKGPGGEKRRGVPTLKQFREMYETRQDLVEKVREFIAVEILEVQYVPFKELQKMKEDVEKAKAKAEAKAEAS